MGALSPSFYSASVVPRAGTRGGKLRYPNQPNDFHDRAVQPARLGREQPRSSSRAFPLETQRPRTRKARRPGRRAIPTVNWHTVRRSEEPSRLVLAGISWSVSIFTELIVRIFYTEDRAAKGMPLDRCARSASDKVEKRSSDANLEPKSTRSDLDRRRHLHHDFAHAGRQSSPGHRGPPGQARTPLRTWRRGRNRAIRPGTRSSALRPLSRLSAPQLIES